MIPDIVSTDGPDHGHSQHISLIGYVTVMPAFIFIFQLKCLFLRPWDPKLFVKHQFMFSQAERGLQKFRTSVQRQANYSQHTLPNIQEVCHHVLKTLLTGFFLFMHCTQ